MHFSPRLCHRGREMRHRRQRRAELAGSFDCDIIFFWKRRLRMSQTKNMVKKVKYPRFFSNRISKLIIQNIFVAPDENALRKAHALRSTGGLRSSAPRSNLQLARSLPSSYRRFRVFARHITLRRGDDTAGPHANAHQRGARRFRDPPREPRLGSGSRGCARGRVRSLESGPAGDSVERSSSRKPRARGLGNAGRTRARDARGAFGAVDFEAKVASRRSEARRTRARFRGRAIPRGARRFSGFPRRIRLRPSATVHHEAAGGVEDAQAVHDYQEP